jgi:hypothetical protein
MIGLIVHFGMPSVLCPLNIWKHQSNMDGVVVKHLGIELILAVRKELLERYIISLIAMKITLGLCYDGVKDHGKNSPRGFLVQ